jgi:mycoredoxin
MENAITVYGTSWCGDCIRVRRFLDENKIEYRWIDIDYDADAENFVLRTNHGFRSVPTIILADGSTLVEPTTSQLKGLLESIMSSY